MKAVDMDKMTVEGKHIENSKGKFHTQAHHHRPHDPLAGGFSLHDSSLHDSNFNSSSAADTNNGMGIDVLGNLGKSTDIEGETDDENGEEAYDIWGGDKSDAAKKALLRANSMSKQKQNRMVRTSLSRTPAGMNDGIMKGGVVKGINDDRDFHNAFYCKACAFEQFSATQGQVQTEKVLGTGKNAMFERLRQGDKSILFLTCPLTLEYPHGRKGDSKIFEDKEKLKTLLKAEIAALLCVPLEQIMVGKIKQFTASARAMRITLELAFVSAKVAKTIAEYEVKMTKMATDAGSIDTLNEKIPVGSPGGPHNGETYEEHGGKAYEEIMGNKNFMGSG